MIPYEKLKIACVIPVYNEAAGIAGFLSLLARHLLTLSQQFRLILVNDGSSDETGLILDNLHLPIQTTVIHFSRNFGKEQAILAGLTAVTEAAAILIDGDGQHPIELISLLIANWHQGYNMVYGVRSCRKEESLLKQKFTKLFYRVINLGNRNPIPQDAGDFRLLDQKVIQAFIRCPEKNRFSKGLYAWVGFKTKALPFQVKPRNSGKTKWSFRRLFSFGITGFTAFSDLPLRILSASGFILSLISLGYGLYVTLQKLFSDIPVPGYATIVVAIFFLGGMNLLGIGILGEYIANIYREVKQRPNYLIDNVTEKRPQLEPTPELADLENR